MSEAHDDLISRDLRELYGQDSPPDVRQAVLARALSLGLVQGESPALPDAGDSPQPRRAHARKLKLAASITLFFGVLALALSVSLIALQDSERGSVTLGKGSMSEHNASGELVLREGWALLDGRQRLRVTEHEVELMHGRALVLAGDAVALAATQPLIETLDRESLPLSGKETLMLKNIKNWRIYPNLAACLLTGTLLIDGQRFTAQEATPEEKQQEKAVEEEEMTVERLFLEARQESRSNELFFRRLREEYPELEKDLPDAIRNELWKHEALDDDEELLQTADDVALLGPDTMAVEIGCESAPAIEPLMQALAQAQLPYLAHVEVYNADAHFEYTGGISEFIKILSRFENLVSLQFTDLFLTELGSLQELAELRQLELDYVSPGESGLQGLESCENLRWLEVYANEDIVAEDLKALSSLTQLTHLKVLFEADDVAWFLPLMTELVNLETLQYSSDVAGFSLKYFSKLSKLQELSLSRDNLDFIDPEYLPNLSSLRKLWLIDSKFSPSSFAHLAGMTSIEELQLEGSDISDECAETLATLTNLKQLYLSKTSISDATLEKLAPLTKLEIIHLNECKIDGSGLRAAKEWSSLRILKASRSEFSDVGAARIAHLPLTTLNLQFTPVSDVACETLAKITTLLALNLGSTLITDSGLYHLSTLRHLNSLNLSSTDVEGGVFHAFAAHDDLHTLNLKLTEVTSYVIKDLLELEGLRVLDLSNTQIDDEARLHLKKMRYLEELKIHQSLLSPRVLQKMQGWLPNTEFSWSTR